MPANNSSESTSVVNSQPHICPKCGFENHSSAIYCEICFYPLDPSRSFAHQQPIPQPQSTQKLSTSAPSLRQELRKPSVISGLAVLSLAIALWVNYFITGQPQYLTSGDGEQDLALYDSMNQVRDVPKGLFSYGGALYFASLVAHGMNDAIQSAHPNFALRYTKPNNQDLGYSNGIKMLLDGELSFAFNGRSLIDREYSQAKLRNMTLQQIPIAIDGVVFFGNRQTQIVGLSLNQVEAIFSGKITNWQQLGGTNLPIIPVMLAPENIEILGLTNLDDIPQSTQYTDNYTLALRKVIATPGAIAFASASLVQQQQLIKIFGLASSNSSNYVFPFRSTGEPNLELFQNGKYPLTRRLFLVIRQDGTPDRLAGKAYAEMLLSSQGQEIVRQAGFVPLYGD